MKNHFRYLNEYFDKILVLSLPRLTRRIEHIKKELDGLEYEFFWGVDKATTSLEALKKEGIYSSEKYRSFYKRKKDMAVGMICGAHGHLNIYKEIVSKKYTRTLILEDDALPVQQGLRYIRACFKDLPDDWDMVYLGYDRNEQFGVKQYLKQRFYMFVPNHATYKMTKDLYANYYPRKVTARIYRAGYHDWSHAYGLTLEGAKKILAEPMAGSFHSDNLLSYLIMHERLQGYIVKPKMFDQLTVVAGHFMPSLTQD